MRILLAPLPVLFVVLSFQPARAAASCEDSETKYEKTYCYSKLFVESDNELNAVYKQLHDAVKGGLKDQLTVAQRAWNTYRDAKCANDGTIDVRCNYTINRARAEQLRDRLRECKTGNCRPELISQQSWN